MCQFWLATNSPLLKLTSLQIKRQNRPTKVLNSKSKQNKSLIELSKWTMEIK